MLPLLQKFTQLTSLDLSDNQLISLPNLGGYLPKLTSIDLNNNNFHDIYSVIENLRGLQNLQNLTIGLTDEDQVDFIIQNIGQTLVYLNNHPINDEEEDEPASNQNNLQTDSNQPNTNEQRDEVIQEETAEEEEEYDSVVKETRVLQKSNSNLLKLEFSTKELESLALLYDQIRTLFKRQSSSKDKELSRLFDEKLTAIMTSLSDQISSPQNSPRSITIRNNVILLAKNEMSTLCLEKVIEYLNFSGQDEESQILQSLMERYQEIINTQVKINQSMLKEGFSRNQSEADLRLQAELSRAKKDASDILQAAEKMERDLKKQAYDREQQQIQFEREREEMSELIESLQEENKKITDTLIKHSKQSADKYVTPARSTQSIPKPHSNSSKKIFKSIGGIQGGGVVGPVQLRNLTLKQLKDMIAEIYDNKVKYDQKCEDLKLPRETMEEFMYTYLNQKYGLKDIIIQWAASIIFGIEKFAPEDHEVALFGKILRNECDEEFRLIQQHVKTTIEALIKQAVREKFPQKPEIEINRHIEEIHNSFIDTSIWRKVIGKMYESQDNQILERKFQEIVSTRIQKQMPKIDTQQVNSYINNFSLREIIRGKKRLTREDQNALLLLKNQEKLYYSEFLKTVLDFQLREHEKFLRKFVLLFKTVDLNNDGIMDESEFSELAGRMKILNTDQDLVYFLQIVDPFNNQHITFSEVVQLFSVHMVDGCSLLEKFSKDESLDISEYI